jgi:hypothetical protein
MWTNTVYSKDSGKLRKTLDTTGVTEPTLNYENFRHYRCHRRNSDLRKTSDIIGVTETMLNYENLQAL